MTLAIFVATQVGPHTSIQDGGRRGWMRFGVPRSGPMDRLAYAAANAALGNHPQAPQIEISLGGLTLECVEGAVTIALAGGGFHAAADNLPFGAWTVVSVKAGSKLLVKPGFWGNWCCLAFAGRLRASPWLGSVSTHGPSGLGGGRVVTGQRIVIEDAALRPEREGSIPFPISARPSRQLRVVLGPQDRFFSPGSVEDFLSQPFSLTGAYDRMGVRLRGPALPPTAPLDMPSEAVVRGSVQVAGDGVATVLLADHQTTGGYPKIATVLSADLDAFVQVRPGSPVVFSKTTPAEAIVIARRHHHQRSRYLARVGEGAGSGAR